MQLTNGWGQPIKPDWIEAPLTVERIAANLGGLEHLEMSRASARKLTGGHVPRCGYELTVLHETLHEHHVRTLYLVNVSNAKYYFRIYESPCFRCHKFVA